MKDRSWQAGALDVAAFCREGARLEARTPLAAMPRLAASVLAPDDGVAAEVAWSAQGTLRPVAVGAPELWVELAAEVPVHLECQRCLKPLAWPLKAERRLRFVHGEDEAARLDEENEDDVLALEARTDLRSLVEDELILALPLVPTHADCELPAGAGAEAEPAEADAEPHPFAALASLRGKVPGDSA